MEAIVVLDSQGRVTLPKAFLEELNLKPGARLNLSVEGNTIILTPVLQS